MGSYRIVASYRVCPKELGASTNNLSGALALMHSVVNNNFTVY
jgi:hypothetical protein